MTEFQQAYDLSRCCHCCHSRALAMSGCQAMVYCSISCLVYRLEVHPSAGQEPVPHLPARHCSPLQSDWVRTFADAGGCWIATLSTISPRHYLGSIDPRIVFGDPHQKSSSVCRHCAAQVDVSDHPSPRNAPCQEPAGMTGYLMKTTNATVHCILQCSCPPHPPDTTPIISESPQIRFDVGSVEIWSCSVPRHLRCRDWMVARGVGDLDLVDVDMNSQ